MKVALSALLAALLAAAPASASDPRLEAAAAKVDALWEALPDRASFSGAEARWKQRLADMCPSSEINCALSQYESWTRFLEAAKPQQIEGATVRGLSEMRWDAESGYTIDLAYPELQGARFSGLNQFVADDAHRRADRLAAEWSANGAAARAFWPSEATQSFAVPLVTERLVTVDFEDHQYNSGAAHGMPSSWSVLFDLERGRPLDTGDLFQDDRWVQIASELAEATLRKQLGRNFQGNADSVHDVVVRIENWSFRKGEAVITFPVYTVAPYVNGPQKVTVPYDQLASSLRTDAPLPR